MHALSCSLRHFVTMIKTRRFYCRAPIGKRNPTTSNLLFLVSPLLEVTLLALCIQQFFLPIILFLLPAGTHVEEAIEVALQYANSEHGRNPISQAILIGDAPSNTKDQVLHLFESDPSIFSCIYRCFAGSRRTLRSFSWV